MLDVLAYCNDVQVWTPATRYAAELAANLGASLTGVHVSQPWPAREPQGTPPSVVAELVACAQEEISAAMQAGTRFAAWARGLGVESTKWHVALGDPAEVLGVAGNWNDLIVIDRKIGDRNDTMDLICQMLLSGCVCVAVPDSGYAVTRFDRIAVAFDGSPASIRALHAATPLLCRAGHTILLQNESEADNGDAPKTAFDPLRYFADRRIAVETERVESHGAARATAIVESASRNRANLLVAGAHGKRRLSDCRLDDTPRQLLNYAGIPLLMAG